MRDFKDEQIIFYCNCLGELHKGGKESLKSVEDLPLPLQRVYETFWTDCLSVPCYIAYVDGRPGLLLAAEYNEELCDEESIPYDYFLKYEVLCDRSTKLEKLVQTVPATAEVGIGVDTAPDPELMVFIPTQAVSGPEILKIYYLMHEFAYTVPPDEVEWSACNCKLAKLAARRFVESEERKEIFAKLNDEAEGRTIHYMGMSLPQAGLPKMDDVVAYLKERLPTDLALDHYRHLFQLRFGHHLVCKYPCFGDLRSGGAMIPVREGFLHISYEECGKRGNVHYDLASARLLNAEDAAKLREAYRSQTSGLCAALDDMARELDVPTVCYTDAQGNLYFVRTGIGSSYKAFRRYAAPKKGQRRESGLHAVPYRSSHDLAQRDLDVYAEKHGLQPVEGGCGEGVIE